MIHYDTSGDKELLIQSKDGDKKAQGLLIHKYKNLVRIKAKAYFIMGADKDDIIQEGMIGLFKAMRDYDPSKKAAFYTFAELCITRQILTAIKTANRQKHIPLNSYLSLDKSVYGEESKKTYMENLKETVNSNPEDLFIFKEDKSCTEEFILKTLSSLEYNVLKLYLEGNSYGEISSLIAKDEKAIDNALQRIRKKVGKIVKDKTLDQCKQIC